MSKVTVTYRNGKGEELTFGRVAPFFLKKIEGFGTVENQIISQQLFDYDGEVKVGSHIAYRDITLLGLIKSNSFEDLQVLKRNLIRVINPKDSGELIYRITGKEYRINVDVINVIDGNGDNGSLFYDFDIQLRALSPFWTSVDNEKNIYELQKKVNKYVFPTKLSNQFTFNTSNAGEEAEVENVGDVKVGGIFEIYLSSYTEKPMIYNTTKKEYFGFYVNYPAGTKLIINTIRGQKSITRIDPDGNKFNAVNDRMGGARFLEFDGNSVNKLQLQATEGVKGMSGFVTINPKLLGV
jgi:hypothetical protein